MRKSDFILPAVVMALGVMALSRQGESRDRLVRENDRLIGRLAEWRGTAPTGSGSERASRSPENALMDRGSEWAAAATILRQQGIPDFLTMQTGMRIISRWNSEKADALAKEIGEVGSSDLPKHDKDLVIEAMMEVLSQKDPALAMRLLEGQLSGLAAEDVRKKLENSSGLFARWVKKDAAAAVAWLDRQIAEGTMDSSRLDGTSASRQAFEAQVFKVLLNDSPGTALARISAMNSEDRAGLIRSCQLKDLPESCQLQFLHLARENLSAERVTDALQAALATSVGEEGLQGTSAWFERLQLTAEERGRLTGQAVGRALGLDQAVIKPMEFNTVAEARAWLSEHQQGKPDETLGTILGLRARRAESPTETLEWLGRLSDGQPSDDLIVGFLKANPPGLTEPQMTQLARRITDPSIKALVMTRISQREVRWTDPDQ